jgi:hypothetical protein
MDDAEIRFAVRMAQRHLPMRAILSQGPPAITPTPEEGPTELDYSG